MKKEYNFLSIDAWRDGEGWTWNNWHKIDSFSGDINSETEVRNYLLGYIEPKHHKDVYIDDDGYNIVICSSLDDEPLYAICYGDKE